MKNYVLVMKKGSNVKVGIRSYTEEEALKRQQEVSEMGMVVEVMTFNEALGL